MAAPVEPLPKQGSLQLASGDQDLKTGPLRGVAGDSSSTTAVRRPKPARPALAGGTTTAQREGVRFASPSLRTTSPEHASSCESAGDRSRGARFNAVVDVVYYDSKRMHSSDEESGREDSLDPASDTRAPSHEVGECSAGGFSDEGDELGSRQTINPRSGGPWLHVSTHHATDDAQEEDEAFHLASDLVLAEFVLSLLFILAMIVICLSYHFRRILEQALTATIGVLFSLRAAYDLPRNASKSLFSICVAAVALHTPAIGADLLLLLLMLLFKYAFCYWLTCLTLLWLFAIVGLSAKVASDGYNDGEVDYSYWAPVLYVLLAGWVLASDYSCSVHEYKTRLAFWKQKTADDRLELMEGQVDYRKKRRDTHVAATPLEGAINNLDLIQSMLSAAHVPEKEKGRLQRLLNEARHNLTFTDNIYQFNAETCSDEFAKSYLYDLRREGISKPRKLSRQTSLAVRRKSRASTLAETLVFKTNLSKIGVDWSFNCLALGQISQKPLNDVGYAILSPFCLSPDISLNRELLCNFLDELASQYLNNPYHNALHGATVCHMSLCLLEMLSVREFMNDLEDFSVGIAALSHDVGHPGRNNNFMIAASTELAILYNDSSVLENHHASLTFRILSKPRCNILEKVTPGAYRAIRKYVIEWILATDMKMHFDHISSFRTRRMNAEFNLATNEEDRSRIISMCIKAADLGHAATAWEQHEEWCRRVVTEFYEQPLYEELKATDDALQLSKEQEIERICIANLEANAAHWQRKEKGAPE
ncbi:hypothetical protein Emed_007002 [Eimeria media]